VNDDPFRAQVLLSLIGTGGKAVAVSAAVVMHGLFLLWTIVERFARRARSRSRGAGLQAPPHGPEP